MHRLKLILAILVMHAGASQAATVSLTIDADPGSISVGDTFSLAVYGDYSGTGALLGGAFDLGFDASVLNVTNVQITAPHSIGDSVTDGSIVIDNTGGSIQTVGFADYTGIAPGLYSHALITFEAVGAGFSGLSLYDSNDLIYAWFNEEMEGFTVTGVNGSVTVSAVPVPAAAWLLGSGLLGLIGAARSRRHG